MAEGISDGGQRADAGHESGRPSGRRRPDDVPAGHVWDRQAKTWREPRKPGPRNAAGGDGEADNGEDRDGGWRADRDPGAAHLSGGAPEPEAPGRKVSQEDRDDVAGLLALLAIPVGALAELRDPYCGAVFADSMPRIVSAATPIVCRSDKVMRWLTAGSGGLMDWIGLARALAPVAGAVVHHHVLRDVQLVSEDQDDDGGELAGAAA